MTAEMSYSYLDLDFVVRISEEVMIRAVRVKVAAKDKIKRIFESNIATLSSVSENPSEVVEEKGLVSLIDASEENLTVLNDKVNAMIEQPTVSCIEKRAVLFTKALATKIKGVNEKMFDGMPVSKRKVASVERTILPNVEIANHLGGDVLSSVWTNVPENIQSLVAAQNDMPSVEEIPVVPEPSLQEIESVLPKDANGDVVSASLESNDSKEIVLPSFIPNIDEDFVATSVGPTVESEEISADSNLKQNDVPNIELPGFMPELGEDFVAEPASLNEPVALENEDSQEVSSVDYVAEPKMIGEDEYVNEPSIILGFEGNDSMTNNSDVVDIGHIDETTHEEVPVEVEPKEEPEGKLSIEDRIAELLNRKNAIHQEQEATESVNVSEVKEDEKVDVSMPGEKPELTQAGIIARIQRINNTMKEKDAAIKNITSKYEIAKQEVNAAKQKIAGYEEVVSDLTIRNNALMKENERLSNKVEEAQTASQSTITKLETQVSELTDAKNLESENSKKTIAELKSKHEKEISALREKHAKELALANETRDKQIQAILGTLTEALGETNLEQEYDGPSLAA